jgi:hypothetical protein
MTTGTGKHGGRQKMKRNEKKKEYNLKIKGKRGREEKRGQKKERASEG